MRQSKLIAAVLVIYAMAGCVDPAQQTLRRGYDALDAQQYEEAINRADEYLQQQPAGPGSAEALYLRGRAYERKLAANPAEASKHLQEARRAYIDALKLNPGRKLTSYIRTSLANVAYFQEDYETALTQWTAAYEALQEPEVKAWVLYRIGLCQQRLGRFDAADRTFAAVEQSYRGSLPAQRAREHVGMREFYVQVGVYSSVAGADKASGQVRQAGAVPVRFVDNKGRYVIRAGPYKSYKEARNLRERLNDRFPDALVIP
jgi:TolA-binding protein